MIKVYQTITGKNGNCFNACLASILEVDIKNIPTLKRDKVNGNWIGMYQPFLKPMNLSLHWCDTYGSNEKIQGYAIGSFKVPGEGNAHAIVCYNGRKIHDPKKKTPKSSRVGKLLYWLVLTVLDPTKPVIIKLKK